MTMLRAIILGLIMLAALVSLIGLSMGLYELVAGRLVPLLTRLRRRVPANRDGVRQNALALVLNEVAVLLMLLPVLGALQLEQARVSALLATTAIVVSMAGLIGSGVTGWAAYLIKRKVKMVSRIGHPQDALSGA